MSSVARKNLFKDIPRFLVAQAGIMFAVSLVTIQVGILNGFTRSTTLLIDQSDSDFWIASKDMLYLDVTLPIPLDRLLQARKVEGVAKAEAVMARVAIWRDPEGRIVPVRIYGFNPNGQLFANWKIVEGSLAALNQPYSILIDRANKSSLNLSNIADTGTIRPLKATVVGFVEDTQSISSNALLFASLETANAFGAAGQTASVNCQLSNGNLDCINSFETELSSSKLPSPPRKLNLADPITYILVKAKPGEDLEQLQRRLEKALPATRVLPRTQMAAITRDYWTRKTGVGFILGLGATVGVIVGIVVVSQILYSSVSEHIREYGTLKAMGASDWVIYGVITEQALWMAVLGYLPSMVLCLGLGTWTMAAKGIVILITPLTALGVFGITVVMCTGSALFAIQKVMKVDPAIVFKA